MDIYYRRMHGIGKFTDPAMVNFSGKSRQVYHTWILWKYSTWIYHILQLARFLAINRQENLLEDGRIQECEMITCLIVCLLWLDMLFCSNLVLCVSACRKYLCYCN